MFPNKSLQCSLFNLVFGGSWLVLGDNWLVLVQLHEFGKIELRLLEDLYFPYHAVVVEWENFAALLLNLLANILFNQGLDHISERGLLDSSLHDLHHLLSDELLVGSFGVARGLNLSWSLLGEGDAEQSHEVSVGGLGLNEGLNEGVPLLDHGAGMVSGDIHSVEVGIAIISLDFIDLELHSSPGFVVGGISGVVAISKRQSEDTSS